MLITLLLLAVAALLLRIYLIKNIRSRGCDAYYFLLTAEVLRKQKKLPLVLPDYYLLDIPEQWYPPGFSVFLALISANILYKYHWLISPLLDLVNLVLLLIAVTLAAHSWLAALIAGLTYIFTLTLLLEGINLNARFFANVQLTIYMLSLNIFLHYHNYWYLLLCLMTTIIILLTHKMAFQFLCVFSFLAILALASFWPAVILGSAIPLALILTGGYYLKILRSHYDLVSFWNKYWDSLGLNQVYDSPIFENMKEVNRQKDTPLAKLGFLAGMKFLLVHQPFLIVIIITLLLYHSFAVPTLYWLWFVTGILIFLATTYVNKLKLFGEGYKYLKFTAFPGAFLLGTLLYRQDHSWLFGLKIFWLIIIIVLAAALLYKYRQGWLKDDYSALHNDERDMFSYLQVHPEIDRLLCIPPHLCDAIVFHCRKQVLWGTHHYLFNERVYEFYPLLRYPLKYFVGKYGVKYCLINKNYAEPAILELVHPLVIFGDWVMYDIQDI